MVNASEAQLEAKASEIEPRSRAVVAIPHIIVSSIHPIESIAVIGAIQHPQKTQNWMQIYEIGVSCELAFEFVKKNKLRKGVWGVG